MAHIDSASNLVNHIDGANHSTNPSESFRPHYYTTFQSYCCDSKPSEPSSTQTKSLLPIPQNFKDEAERLLGELHRTLIENPAKIAKFTSVIPRTFLERSYKNDIQRYLIDRVMFKTMNDAHVVNWMSSLKMLYPIRTSGNGNCLLHAALIAMVGIQDMNLYLRDQLIQFMESNTDILKTHWRIERLKSDKNYGITRSDDSTLDKEWKELCDLVRYENHEDGQIATHLEYLEAVHIFSVSNMLRRPIIVLSEDVIRNKNGEAISVNDLFGIYLPILSLSRECVKEPIVLAYDRSHFCALQTDDTPDGRDLQNVLPLYLSFQDACNKKLLPIRFLGNDENIEHVYSLLHAYLKTITVEQSLNQTSMVLSILCAQLGDSNLIPQKNFIGLYQKYLYDFFDVQKPKAIEEERKRQQQHELDCHLSHLDLDYNRSRSIVQQDPVMSSTFRSISPRLKTSIHDKPTPNHNYYSYDQKYTQNGVSNSEYYTPRNGAVYFENSSSQSQNLPRAFEHIRVASGDSGVDHNNVELAKQPYPKIDSNNINNLKNNYKHINTVNVPIGQDKMKYERETPHQNSIEIPVEITPRSRARVNGRGLFYDDDERDLLTECVVCNRAFKDNDSIRICPKCDQLIHQPSSRDAVLNRPLSRLPPTNIYLTGDDVRYRSVLSPAPKVKPNSIILCPHCKNRNVNHAYSGVPYYCSVCQKQISSPHLYL